jgi:short-subunit dehydrogenase
MIIWITGAGSGLGRELARQYAAEGHLVVATARTKQDLDVLAREGADLPGGIYPLACDVTDREAVKALFQRIWAEVGIPDKIILNAGTHIPTPLSSFDQESHRSLMEVNYMGVVHCLGATLPLLIERGRGQVAVVASLASYRGLPYAGAYGASKAALVNLAEALRPEMEQAGLDLRLVCPGFVRTPLTDRNDFHMPFLMEVEDAAAAMRRGLDGNSFRIVFPRRLGWIMTVLKVLPDRMFLAVSRKMLRD